MDEAKNEAKNTPNPDDEDSSGKGKGETPPPAKGKKSDEELDNLLIARGSHVGRENKRLTEQITSLTQERDNLGTRLRQVERDIRESKLDRSDPNAIRAFEQAEDLQSRIDAVDKQKRANTARSMELDEQAKDVANERIAIIAEKYSVDAQDLKDLGTNNREALVKYAIAVSKGKEGGEGEGGEGDTKAKAKKKGEGDEEPPDSNKVSGADESVLADSEKLSKLPESQQVALLKKKLGKTG